MILLEEKKVLENSINHSFNLWGRSCTSSQALQPCSRHSVQDCEKLNGQATPSPSVPQQEALTSDIIVSDHEIKIKV